MKMTKVAGAAIAITAVLASATAFAAVAAVPIDTQPVTIPWGDWASALLMTTSTVVIPAVAWAMRKVPSNLRWLLVAARVEQLLTVAMQDAINRTAGAVAGKTYDLDTGIVVANNMLRYAVQAAPELVKQFGLDAMWLKVLARVPFGTDVAVPRDLLPADRSILSRAAR
jgi:hypothetical protein